MTGTMRRHAAWLGLLAALSLTVGAGAKPLNPNAPKKPQSTEKPKGGPAVPRTSRRVVVVSLDGAGAEELQQLWKDDLLDEGGFARFFREGEVASALVPVDPTLGAPNHVSLATGAAPDHTGITGNRFHPAGAPPFATANGFTFPIGAETLWEAVRRQKKRAAVMAWPGVDGSEPRRRAEIGMTYTAAPEREARLVVLKRADWQPAAAGAPKLASRSPVLAAHVTLPGAGGTGAGGEAGAGAVEAAGFDLYAVDRTAGGQANYDGVVVATGRAPSVANLEQSDPLAQGQWAEVTFPDRGGRAVCWVKVLALDPALETVRVYFSGTYGLQVYPADLARDLAESNLAWPGPPDDARLAAAWRGEGGIDLDTWTEQAERFAAFFGGALRAAATRDDWDLMIGTIPVIDKAGLLLSDPHQEGYSAARRDDLVRARRRVWQAVDRELRLLMTAVDLGRTTVVVVSDHGVAPVHTIVDLNALLRERGWLATPPAGAGGGSAAAPPAGAAGAGVVPGAGAAAGLVPGAGASAGAGLAVYAVGDGGMAHLYLAGPAGPAGAGGGPAAAAARQKQLLELRDQLLAWHIGDETPIERVLTRQEAAELSLDHPNSGDLIVFAREGWAFDAGPAPAGTATTRPATDHGMQGYLSSHPDMQGVYLAIGKDIRPGRTSGPVAATEVAWRVAQWLGVEKPRAGAAAGGAGPGAAGAPGSSPRKPGGR